MRLTVKARRVRSRLHLFENMFCVFCRGNGGEAKGVPGNFDGGAVECRDRKTRELSGNRRRGQIFARGGFLFPIEMFFSEALFSACGKIVFSS